MDRKDRLKAMMSDVRSEQMTQMRKSLYEIDNEKDIILDAQKCQRNWNYDKKIEYEYMDYFLWLAKEAPSKQHEGYYDVYYTTDRKVIQECSNYTWGCTHDREPPSTWQNSQQNASAYILFVAKEPITQMNCNADGTLKSNKTPARWENSYVSIGIALGIILRAANALGFVTGCNKSHGDMSGDEFWHKKLGILDDVKAGTKKIAYGIGIGFPNEGRPRWESDQTMLALGAANGSDLTTDHTLEKHPRTGQPTRKIKLVDITEHKGKIMKDPYGNEHLIPDNADIKINQPRERGIKVIEIK
jgi:hypothetical protein